VRNEKSELLILLARKLAASAEGLTLDEMREATGEKRRTVERLRDSILRLFPQTEDFADGRSKRFRIPGGLDAFMQCPTKEELLELKKVAEDLRTQGATVRAQALEQLELKIRVAMRKPVILRIEPDLEALLQAELIARQAGPRPVEEPEVFLCIRSALLDTKALRFVYLGGSNPGASRDVVPFGIIFGRMNYLIGSDLGTDHPKHFRLDRIQQIEMLHLTASRPTDFDLAKFANASFGFFQGEIHDVVLHVFPRGIDDDFKNWRFHPDQTVEMLADGGALVRFRASGMLELAWHLFTWGDKLEIVAPVTLRETLATELRVALGRHENEPHYALRVP
jgi:predicted DNA-binding transcriptional regulator YafY